MKKVVIFHFAGEEEYPYEDVEQQANDWLTQHPDAVIIASHTDQSSRATTLSKEQVIDFALTLIVEIPEDVQP